MKSGGKPQVMRTLKCKCKKVIAEQKCGMKKQNKIGELKSGGDPQVVGIPNC